MEQRVHDLENLVQDLSEDLRTVRADLRALRREVRGGGVGSAPSEQDSVASLPVRSTRDSRASDAASDSLGSFSLVRREFNENASRSRSGPSPGSPTPSVASATTAGSTRNPLTWLQREEICDEIGAYIRRALEGDHRGASGRDRIQLASRVWLVFQDYEGLRYEPVHVCRTFGQCRALVKRGEDLGDSIFVGLPSEREAIRVASVAGVPWPASLE